MSETIIYILLFGSIPLIFIIVGVTLIIKGFKQIYKSHFARMKVLGRCIEVQETTEEGTTLYRPVYEIEHNGAYLRASKIDYEYEKRVLPGDNVQIYVEKKHPDVVVEAPGSIVSAIIIMFMGATFAFSALSFIVPFFLHCLWSYKGAVS